MSQSVATQVPRAGDRKSSCTPPVQKLKSERVQEALAAMGWKPDRNVRTFARALRFPVPRVAEAYAAYVSALANQSGQPVSVEVAGKRVLVTLLSRAASDRHAGWTKAVLDFAKRLLA